MRYAPTATVLELLGVSSPTLTARMRESVRAGIRVPWRNVGTPGRPIYRWPALACGTLDAQAIDHWLEDLDRWRATRPGATATPSVGAPYEERPAANKSPRKRPRKPFAGPSSEPTTSGGSTSLTPSEMRRRWEY